MSSDTDFPSEPMASRRPAAASEPPHGRSSAAVYRIQRTLSRILALQFLYEMEMQPDQGYSPEAFDDFLELAETENDLHVDARVYRKAAIRARKLLAMVEEHRGDIDAMIRAAADNWDLRRMNCIDRNLLRLAVAEMRYDDKVGVVVAINEAIELSKQYGQPESPKFINGVLDNVRRQLEAMPLDFGSGSK